jgi:hypothetical protein
LFDIIYRISETMAYKIICLHLCCSMGGLFGFKNLLPKNKTAKAASALSFK